METTVYTEALQNTGAVPQSNGIYHVELVTSFFLVRKNDLQMTLELGCSSKYVHATYMQ